MNCDESKGSITLTTSGGVAPYEFQLDQAEFQSGNSFSQLAGGSYSVKAKDAQGCIVEEKTVVSNGIGYVSHIKSIIQANCAVSGLPCRREKCHRLYCR